MNPIGPNAEAARTVGTRHRNRHALRARSSSRGVSEPFFEVAVRIRGRARQNGGVSRPGALGQLRRGRAVDHERSEAPEVTPPEGEGPAPLDDAARAERLQALTGLIDLMRPAVQADGGDLVLVAADVDAGVVEVQLQGACSSCAISSATLQGGVERILRDRLPWMTEVRGGVDETLDPFTSEAMGRGGYVPSF